jgi:ribosomal protein L11 methyltransferase
MRPARPVPDAWRVIVEAEPADAELVSDVLWRHGALGIEEQDGAGGRVRLLAGMADRTSADSAAAELSGALTEPVTDDSWADAWRGWARPSRVGGVVVRPAWLADDPDHDDATVVTIDPGRAFGSGSHESTTLALRALIDHTPAGGRVLDVGCGSGVLAVAVARVAGASVVAIDIDEHAVEVTRANAERNDVGSSVVASTTPIADVEGTFDVVVANLLAVTLRELAPTIARRARSGGHVVLSGMLAAQEGAVAEAFRREGLGVVEVARDGAWSALVLLQP